MKCNHHYPITTAWRPKTNHWIAACSHCQKYLFPLTEADHVYTQGYCEGEIPYSLLRTQRTSPEYIAIATLIRQQAQAAKRTRKANRRTQSPSITI